MKSIKQKILYLICDELFNKNKIESSLSFVLNALFLNRETLNHAGEV